MPFKYLKTIAPDAECVFAVDALLQRPKHAEIIAQTISIWSHIEHQLGLLFTFLCGPDVAQDAIKFSELRTLKAQKSRIDDAANSRLQGEDISIWDAILRSVEKNARLRNEFAHHIWGYSEHPRLSDAALLLNPRIDWKRSGRALHYYWHGSPSLDISLREMVHDASKIRVYQVKDLIEARSKITELYSCIAIFHAILFNPFIQIDLERKNAMRAEIMTKTLLRHHRKASS